MTETGSVTTTTPAPAAVPAKRKRGRESAGDMVRSLGVVMVLVVGLWFFGQASPSDSHRVRPVDPRQEVTDFARSAPGVPLPRTAPAGFVPNVSTLSPAGLRIGFVIGKDHFAEYAASRERSFVTDQTGRGEAVGTVDVAGTPWQHVRAGGHDSLVKAYGPVSVVVGGTRDTATLAELTTLAASLS